MSHFNYYELIKKSKDKAWIRKKMIDYYFDCNNYSKTARKFDTSRKTIRKWVKRYLESNNDYDSLRDQSKEPNTIANKMDQETEKKIVKICKKKAKYGKRIQAAIIKRFYDIDYSLKPILRVIKEYDFIKSKKKKKIQKNNLIEKKKIKYSAFDKIQVDIKYLTDIKELKKEREAYNLPSYQFTARCVRTGALFISYGYSKTLNNAFMFVDKLLNHLKKNNIDISKVKIQTDNGTEFVNLIKNKKSIVTKLVENKCSKHLTIPPRACTWQSDVETSHRLIEDEFYAFRIFENFKDFMNKANIYVSFFNNVRINTYKRGSPKNILEELGVDLNNNLLDFEPVVLDNFLDKYVKEGKFELVA